jgi:DNA-binding SARP family transcriptional activator
VFSTQHDEPAQVRLQVLGPLRAWRGDAELDTGPRQQGYLLALLLARVGRPTSVSELIDLLWDDEVPRSAINILQKYVGAIRRLLEPDLPVRESGTFVQRRGGGYALTPVPGVMDLVDFRLSVDAARIHLAAGRLDEAFDDYVQALTLWHGHAGDGLTHSLTAAPLFAHINNEFFEACVAAADLAKTQGHSDRVVQPLRLAAWMAPLNEAVQASLIGALSAAGQQAEALSVFDGVRHRLADELGVSPGPGLRAMHARVLDQTAGAPAETTASRTPRRAAAPPSEGNGTERASPEPPQQRAPLAPALGSDADVPAAAAAPFSRDRLIGREAEFAVLTGTLDRAGSADASLVIIEGEPGAGKTYLVETFSATARSRGFSVAWGRCLSHEGTPALWPWAQAFGELRKDQPADVRAALGAGELGRLLDPGDDTILGGSVLPDSGAQFRLFEQAVALVARVSQDRPVLLVLDDMQWADLASLHLFKHLASQLPPRVVLVGALRDRAPRPGLELGRTLAAVGRLDSHQRVRLGPLPPADVAELVGRETGRTPTVAIARSIQARTEGNPFFVRELARLLAEHADVESTLADHGVPATVRDIVRDRMSTLGEDTRVVVQRAALMGREVDLRLLARASQVDVEACMLLLEPADSLGLIQASEGSPIRLAFAHDLVRESVIQSTSQLGLGRLHLQIAEALEAAPFGDESSDERLAHHLTLAGPLASPERTTVALLRAGRRAISRSAFDASVPHLEAAARISRDAGLLELELSALSQLVAVIGMQSGYMGQAEPTSALLERAETVARALGRERTAADFLFSHWAAYSQAIQLDRSGALARRLLTEGEKSSDTCIQAYGRHAWGIHQWDVGNIGDAYRFLSESNAAVRRRSGVWHDEPLRHDLQLLSPAMLGLNTILHGRITQGRTLFKSIEEDAGDHSYDLAVWSAFAVTAAALMSDTHWARRAADRGISADPEHRYVFLGAYQRLGRCWSRAVSDHDSAQAISEAESLIRSHLTDPARSGLTTWLALLAEMYLVSGDLPSAEGALDRAFDSIDIYGQRYAEGFVRLMQARLMQAGGAATSRVRMVAEEAQALSAAREAHLFEAQAQDFIARLDDPSPAVEGIRHVPVRQQR